MEYTLSQNTSILDCGDHLRIYRGVGDNLGPEYSKSELHSDIHIPANTKLFYYIDWNHTSLDRHLTLHLDASGAHAEIIGKFIASKQHQINLNSTIAHHAPNTTGNCFIKGVLHDHSQVSLSGMIQIDHLANNSYDQLTERLLVVSPHAIGQLKPELEILTNDVKASHATTISRPDPEQLLYLQSRGLKPELSQDLLINGFLAEISAKFPITI